MNQADPPGGCAHGAAIGALMVAAEIALAVWLKLTVVQCLLGLVLCLAIFYLIVERTARQQGTDGGEE